MTVREAFRQERGRLWRTASRDAIDLLDFAEAVCCYARGGDWTWDVCPLNPAIAHRQIRRLAPEYTALQDQCRALLFPPPPNPWIERLRELGKDILK